MGLTEIPTSNGRETERWPIFVISLADAHERRQRMQTQCAELGLEFEFFDAIDGRSGLPPELEVEIDREAAMERQRRPLSDAEFACALSHRRIYQRILRDGLPGAVVLEDDVILGPGFARFVTLGGYRSAELIQMGYGPARIFRYRNIRWSDDIKLAALAAGTSSAMAYSISTYGAQYILDQTSRISGVADWPIDVMPLAPLITLPMIVAHPPRLPENSTIEASRSILEEEYFSDLMCSQTELPIRKRRRLSRFGRSEYWRRWIFKRATRWIKGVEQR